jgi:hypothetical protein
LWYCVKLMRCFFSPKFQTFASLLPDQPPEAQEAFQLLPATAMHEGDKFGLLNVAEEVARR